MKNKLHILHVSSEKSWRGGEQQIAYLIEELSQKDLDQTVMLRADSAFEKYCIKNNTNYFRHSNYFGLLASYNKIKKIKPDIIHVHTGKGHSQIALINTFFKKIAPVVVSRRIDKNPSNGFFTRNKYKQKNADIILCVSNAIRDIMKYYTGDDNRIKTIYSGIDTGRFKNVNAFNFKNEFNIDLDSICIGNVAALVDHKDWFTFIETAKLLRAEINAHFFIIGNGILKNKIEEYIKKNNAEEYIHMLGYRKDIPSLLKGLDYFLFTSKTEGLGTSVLDALASGIPVVASAAGGVPEIIEDLKTGILCSTENARQLKNGILQLEKKPDLKETIIKNGKQLVAEKFAKAETANQTFKVYNQIIKA